MGRRYRHHKIKAKDRVSYQHKYYMKVTKPKRHRQQRRDHKK